MNKKIQIRKLSRDEAKQFIGGAHPTPLKARLALINPAPYYKLTLAPVLEYAVK